MSDLTVYQCGRGSWVFPENRKRWFALDLRYISIFRLLLHCCISTAAHRRIEVEEEHSEID